jgi:hypothetical protein
MIETMNIVALVIGALFGLWCLGRRDTISWIFVIFHSSAFSTKQGFYNLYDAADDELSYKRFLAHESEIETYVDYLKLHADARTSAYAIFKETYGSLVKSVAFRILPIVLAPAALFWSNWYFYLIGVATILTGLVVGEVIKNGIRPGFYQRLVVFDALRARHKRKLK